MYLFKNASSFFLFSPCSPLPQTLEGAAKTSDGGQTSSFPKDPQGLYRFQATQDDNRWMIGHSFWKRLKKRGQLEDAMFLYVFPIPFGFFTPQEFHTIPIARKSWCCDVTRSTEPWRWWADEECQAWGGHPRCLLCRPRPFWDLFGIPEIWQYGVPSCSIMFHHSWSLIYWSHWWSQGDHSNRIFRFC